MKNWSLTRIRNRKHDYLCVKSFQTKVIVSQYISPVTYILIRADHSMTKTWRSSQLAVRVRSPPFSFLHPSFDHILFSSSFSSHAELNTLIRVNGWPAASGRFLKSLFPRPGRVQRSAFTPLGPSLWALYHEGPRPHEIVVSPYKGNRPFDGSASGTLQSHIVVVNAYINTYIHTRA